MSSSLIRAAFTVLAKELEPLWHHEIKPHLSILWEEQVKPFIREELHKIANEEKKSDGA